MPAASARKDTSAIAGTDGHGGIRASIDMGI